MFKEKPRKNASIYGDYIDKSVRGVNIGYAASAVNSIRKQSKVNPDTKHRLDIQTYIHKLVSEGNEFIVIWNKLNDRFPDSKYKEYFSHWIKDKIEKSKRTNNKEREI